MAGGKEIKGKIKSIENTKKVTSALEMVSASKIRKSQALMRATRPYSQMMRRIIGHLGKANPEYRHPFTIAHDEVKKVGYIIVSTDRGLCGGLNSNLFKLVLKSMSEWKGKGAEISMVTLGKKASSFFRNIKVLPLSQHPTTLTPYSMFSLPTRSFRPFSQLAWHTGRLHRRAQG